MAQMKAAIYMRVSTGDQSTSLQENELREYARGLVARASILAHDAILTWHGTVA